MIIRTFYPIGQGAFYSERHEGFNIVYDCGNWKKSQLSAKVVAQSFTKNDVIDILFISHFDWDHISHIDTLKNTVKSIKCVIIPLLHKEDIILIKNIHNILDYSSENLIDDPQSYFGNDVKIVRIKPSENNEISSGSVNLDEITSGELDSGTPIKLSNYNWVFIPFNIHSDERVKVLSEALKCHQFDVKALKSDANYTLDKITNKEEKNKIKKIYDSLDGKINSNSMVIYSGCLVSPHKETYIKWQYSVTPIFPNSFYSFFNKCYLKTKVSCIYTGDVNLNEFNLRKTFDKYWHFVSTVQVPHHGSIHNFNSSFLDDNLMICPVSFGNRNNYGHPSYNVISQIYSKNDSQVLKISDDLDSCAIQLITSSDY